MYAYNIIILFLSDLCSPTAAAYLHSLGMCLTCAIVTPNSLKRVW